MNTALHLSIYAAACALALASTVFAADGSNTSDVRANAKRDYDIALANCKQMQGEERSSCRKQARAARDKVLRDTAPPSRPSPDLAGAAIPSFAGNAVR